MIKPWGLVLRSVQCGHHSEDTVLSNPFPSLVELKGRPGQRGGTVENPRLCL